MNNHQAGVLVNHEAKLKGVAKPSDYTQKPGHINTLYRHYINELGNEKSILIALT